MQPLAILYADDDQDDLDLMQEALQEVLPTHKLYSLKRGDLVFDHVKENTPDIIFLDFNLPGCDGSECLRQIKEEPGTKEIPIVMYSTSSAPFHVKECYELGAARYLLKPVTYDGIFKGLELIFGLYSNGQLRHSEFDEFFIDTYKMK